MVTKEPHPLYLHGGLPISLQHRPKLLIITDLAARPHLWTQILVLSEKEVHIDDAAIVTDELNAAHLAHYDMIMLNLHERAGDCVQICQQLRPHYANPLLVILQEEDEDLMVRAFEAGADDCLVQPMSNRLLLAIVNAWLRRAQMHHRT